ncbi:MAG: M23 family metallopeptidase [Bacteroidetes bacterium]|nr:M23 family metallopeptidase [Bacteroidota bacterium]
MPRLSFWMLALWPLVATGQITVMPLDEPLAVSGELAELRNHHFHSGIDLRTGGVTGKNVYAVADGWVRRIVVRPDGYGWALYIDHPTGFTSVYAHLESFHGEIGRYVRREAERLDQYRLDLYPPREGLRVRAGQVIGASGNSGASGGPHLHFELRDQATEAILDPVAYGLRIPAHPHSPVLWTKQSGRWRRAGDSIAVDSWQDLAVTYPEQGFYASVNDSVRSAWSLKRWTFDVQRGADGGLALDLHRQQGVRGFLVHPTPTQPAPGWLVNETWPRNPGRYPLELTSRDRPVWSGNVMVANPRTEREQPEKTWTDGAWSLQVPARAFSSEQPIRLRDQGRSLDLQPDVAAIKPVHFYWTPDGLADSLRHRTYLAVRDGRGSAKIPGVPTTDGRIRYTAKTCGPAHVRVDTNGPKCRFMRRDSDGSVWIHVDDELDPEIQSARINGAWTWAYLDLKAGLVRVEAVGAAGQLVLILRDEVGNRTTFTHTL